MDKQQDDIMEVISEALSPYLHDMLTLEACQRAPRDVLTALEQAGYVVVPVEPTEEMIDAGTGVALERGLGETDDADVATIHRAMLSARPSPLKIE